MRVELNDHRGLYPRFAEIGNSQNIKLKSLIVYGLLNRNHLNLLKHYTWIYIKKYKIRVSFHPSILVSVHLL